MSFIDWLFGQGNSALPTSEYLYGTRHLIVLGVVVFAIVALTLLLRKKDEKTKLKLLTVSAWIFLFWEISTRIINLIKTTDCSFLSILEIILPMHICSVMVWVFIVAGFTKKQWLINFAVIGGLLATVSYLLYPAVGLNMKYITFDALYSIFSHSLGCVVCVCSLTLGIVKFEKRYIWTTFLCFGVMFLWGTILNLFIFPGANFMYLCQNPLGFDTIIPYQIVFAIAFVVYISTFYLVAEIARKHRVKKAKSSETQINS